MTLEFADRSSTQPKGVLEDVIVTVQGHRFPVDFVVLDVKHSGRMAEIPVILGRPFLATARAFKDYEKGKIEFRVSGETFCVETVKSTQFEEPDELDMDKLFKKKYWHVNTLNTMMDPSIDKSDAGKPSESLKSVDSYKNTCHLKVRNQSARADQKHKSRPKEGRKKKEFTEQLASRASPLDNHFDYNFKIKLQFFKSNFDPRDVESRGSSSL